MFLVFPPSLNLRWLFFIACHLGLKSETELGFFFNFISFLQSIPLDILWKVVVFLSTFQRHFHSPLLVYPSDTGTLQIPQSKDAKIFYQQAVSSTEETENSHMGLGLVNRGGGG